VRVSRGRGLRKDKGERMKDENGKNVIVARGGERVRDRNTVVIVGDSFSFQWFQSFQRSQAFQGSKERS
jgi:hypothetical protein